MTENNDYNVSMGIWKALFEFAQNVGASDHVNANPSEYARMSEENKKWLQEALQQFVASSDPVRQMKEALEILIGLDLHNPTSQEQNRGTSALEVLQDLCEDVDNASDFYKIGGFRILIPLLVSSYVDFRRCAAELIGHLSQNHPFCQEKLFESKILQLLLEMMDKDSDENVKLKALYATSCLVRANDKIQDEFMKIDGLSYLMRALDIQNDRTRTKAAFLLMDLFQRNKEFRDVAVGMGMVDQLVAVLGDSDSVAREHVTSALVALVMDCPSAVAECQRPNLVLKEILTQRVKEILDKADYSENADELENCKILLKLCWPEN